MTEDTAKPMSGWWLNVVRQSSQVKRDSQQCCQDMVIVSLVEPMLSVMEKPRTQNRSNPRSLVPWQDTWKLAVPPRPP